MSAFTFTFGTESVVLEVGTYKKVSVAGIDGKKTSKIGTAFLTVADNGAASYCNRRGEVEGPLTHKRVLAILKTGISTLMSTVAVTTEEPTLGVPVLVEDIEATPQAEMIVDEEKIEELIVDEEKIDALTADLDSVDLDAIDWATVGTEVEDGKMTSEEIEALAAELGMLEAEDLEAEAFIAADELSLPVEEEHLTLTGNVLNY
jgi:hypothetical protein